MSKRREANFMFAKGLVTSPIDFVSSRGESLSEQSID